MFIFPEKRLSLFPDLQWVELLLRNVFLHTETKGNLFLKWGNINLDTLLYRFMTYCGYISAKKIIIYFCWNCSVRSPQFEVKWHNRVTSSKASHRVSQSLLNHEKERPYYKTPDIWLGLQRKMCKYLTYNEL